MMVLPQNWFGIFRSRVGRLHVNLRPIGPRSSCWIHDTHHTRAIAATT